MGYGFITSSSNNTIQIDSTYSNIYYDRKIRINSTKPVKLNLSSGEIYAVKPDINKEIATGHFVTYDDTLGMKGVGYVYIFKIKDPVALTVGDYGIEVYKSNSDIAYNNNAKPLRILDQYSIDDDPNKNISINRGIANIGFLPISTRIFGVAKGSNNPYTMNYWGYTTWVSYSGSNNYNLYHLKYGEYTVNSEWGSGRDLNAESHGFLIDLTGL